MDRQNRLNYLNKQNYLSDQELEEKLRLEEELRLMIHEPSKLEKIEIITKKPKRSLLGIIIEHFKEKPVTQEELDELKKKAVKYRLKADIAKSKSQISDIKSKQFDKLMSGLVGDQRTHDDFRKLFGNTNKRFTK